MPRLIDRSRSQVDTATRSQRNKKYRQFRLSEWIDPYPHVLGTRPEKLVYWAFSVLGVPFAYQNWFNASLPEYGFQEWFRPDFIIPSAKLIVEVQGYYWHSQPEQIDSDAFKYAIYETMGYKVITWWDFDIEVKLWSLIATAPELAGYFGKGGRVFTGNEAEIDDSSGVAQANRNRRHRSRRSYTYKVPASKTRSVYSYGVI